MSIIHTQPLTEEELISIREEIKNTTFNYREYGNSLSLIMVKDFKELKVSEQLETLMRLFNYYEVYYEDFDTLTVRHYGNSYDTYSINDEKIVLIQYRKTIFKDELESGKSSLAYLDTLKKERIVEDDPKRDDGNIKSTVKVTSDEDTYIIGKNGYDWVEMTENQRFHAISNQLYYLDKEGMTISRSESYFINGINYFFSDNSKRSYSVQFIFDYLFKEQ
ncbi:hypothetical protein [Bacillus sp. SM2101]|uniref:hypothetical protein n=1 Tax=Bacillus sp. SM2101 TaxID=2805366 RepID=UPI001BDEBDD9|nr:hypothetical protein [Bacillus sp. SM2101]